MEDFRVPTPMTRPWKSIRKRYADITAAQHEADSVLYFKAMLNLVTAIEQSRYATGLHGWTSMHDLYIDQTPVNYPYDGPRLKISPLHEGKLEFRYIDTPLEAKQWHRVVDQSEGFARLEKFLKQLHWFTTVKEC